MTNYISTSHIAYLAIASANRQLVIMTHPIKYVRTGKEMHILCYQIKCQLWLSVNFAVVTCCAGNEMVVVLCNVHTPAAWCAGKGYSV